MRPTGITVASYNLYLGSDLTSIFGGLEPQDLAARTAAVWSEVEASQPFERMQAAARVLVRRLPDVIAVQEAALWRAGTAGAARVHDLLHDLVESLAHAGVRYRVAVRARGFSGEGITEMVSAATGQVVELADRCAILVRDDPAVTVVAGRWGAFADHHVVPVLGRDVSLDRAWCEAEIRIDTSTLYVINTHLELYDAQTRVAQARSLVEQLGADDGRNRLLLGDLNCRPPACRSQPHPAGEDAAEIDGDAYEIVGASGLADAWVLAHPDADPGRGGTCRRGEHDLRDAKAPLVDRIDHVFVDPDKVVVRRADVVGADPEDRTTSGLWPSDHGCLVVELEV